MPQRQGLQPQQQPLHASPACSAGVPAAQPSHGQQLRRLLSRLPAVRPSRQPARQCLQQRQGRRQQQQQRELRAPQQERRCRRATGLSSGRRPSIRTCPARRASRSCGASTRRGLPLSFAHGPKFICLVQSSLPCSMLPCGMCSPPAVQAAGPPHCSNPPPCAAGRPDPHQLPRLPGAVLPLPLPERPGHAHLQQDHLPQASGVA